MNVRTSLMPLLLMLLVALFATTGCKKSDEAVTTPAAVEEAPVAPAEEDHEGHDHAEHGHAHEGHAHADGEGCGCGAKADGGGCGADADCGCGAKDGADCGCAKDGAACGCGAKADAGGCGCGAAAEGHDCGCAGQGDAKGCNCGAKAEGSACGCGGHAGHGDHGAKAADHGGDIMDLVLAEGSFDPAKVVRQPGAKVGDLTRCPVSGEAYVITEQHPHVTHEGKDVYFCCPGCIRRFQRNPARYLDAQ